MFFSAGYTGSLYLVFLLVVIEGLIASSSSFYCCVLCLFPCLRDTLGAALPFSTGLGQTPVSLWSVTLDVPL